MAGPSRHSFPAPSEPSLRRLGVGGPGGGGDRPLRAQIVVALVALLVLLAVPLYLWRRPSGTENVAEESDAGPVASALPAVVDGQVIAPDAAPAEERVRLAAVQKVKCAASARSRGQEGNLCDSLPFFEEALAKAIRENVDCAPRTGKEGTINYVLKIDFTKRQVSVFPGASGAWKGPQARRAAKCVKRSLPAPQWNAIQHQYRYYMIAILATYPVPSAIKGPPGSPVFD